MVPVLRVRIPLEIAYLIQCFDDCFRFRIDNTDHIIDVNKGNMPFEYDQVNIVCPVYAPGTHESDAEKYIIYNVSTFYTYIKCKRKQN